MNENLIDLIKDHARFEGDFKLASGKKSKVYYDMSKLLFLPYGLLSVTDAIFDIIGTGIYDSVGGPADGAIPIVADIVGTYAGTMLSDGKRGFFIRKEQKGHGKEDLIEGQLKKGDKVLMVEDVTTTGNSFLKAIKIVQDFGAEVVQAITVLDREEGAKELFLENNIPFTSLVKVSEIEEV